MTNDSDSPSLRGVSPDSGETTRQSGFPASHRTGPSFGEKNRLLRSLQSLAMTLRVFLEMIKFEHSIFALPFAYLGLILAEGGWPRTSLLILITAAMVSFRTMAMGLNRLIDAAIDSKNPRTQNRALPAGKLQSPFVWSATIFSGIVFEAVVYRIGGYCWTLSPVCVFLAWIYPFTKRFTWLSHTVLGIILGIAPYGAWLASRQEFSWIPGCLTIGVASWVAGFDIIYALQDLEFDKGAGLYSIPSRFGREFSLWLTRGLHLVTIISWTLVGVLANLGPIYFAGMFLVLVFLAREHWLVSSFGLEKLNEAFFTMNAIVSVAVLAAVIADFSAGSIDVLLKQQQKRAASSTRNEKEHAPLVVH